MVRFIIYGKEKPYRTMSKFTFQYGQIYYLSSQATLVRFQKDLHSNMVRFIIKKSYFNHSEYKEIYIPIWLDLLYERIGTIL